MAMDLRTSLLMASSAVVDAEILESGHLSANVHTAQSIFVPIAALTVAVQIKVTDEITTLMSGFR